MGESYKNRCLEGISKIPNCGDGVIALFDICTEVDFILGIIKPSDCQLTRATERRKHIRFSPKDNAYAALGKTDSKVGMIKDISAGGLAFEVTLDDGSQSEIMPNVEIFLANNKFVLSNLPCTIIYQKPVQANSANSTLTSHSKTRRYALKFDELSEDQAKKLVFFLTNYTTEIPATQSYI